MQRAAPVCFSPAGLDARSAATVHSPSTRSMPRAFVPEWLNYRLQIPRSSLKSLAARANGSENMAQIFPAIERPVRSETLLKIDPAFRTSPTMLRVPRSTPQPAAAMCTRGGL